MVKLIKLVTGEEIMGDVEGNEMENPVRVVITQQGVAMVPWCPFTKNKKITLLRLDINAIYIEDADDELANEYRGKFGGVTLATAGAIELGR